MGIQPVGTFNLLSLASLNDEELCRLFEKRSKVSVEKANQAKGILYHRWLPRMRGQVVKLCGTDFSADAEGIAATVLMDCIHAISENGLRNSFANYVFPAVKNHTLRFKRERVNRYAAEEGYYSVAETESRHAPNSYQQLLYKEQVAAMKKAMTALSVEERSILILETYEDMTLAEIAKRSGLPATTVRKRKERAVEKMRRHPAVLDLADNL